MRRSGRLTPAESRNTLAAVTLAEAEISSWIAARAERSPDKLAIRFGDLQISYGELEQRVARLAGALASRAAIAEGDRVAYLGQNAPELLDLLFACARLGAILVPLSARMPAPELEVVLANTEPRALLSEAPFTQTAREAGEQLDLKVIPFGDDDAAGGLRALLDGAPRLPCDRDRWLDTPLLIINTSGTTGPAKGAVLTHASLHFNALNVAAAVGIGADDEVLANGPLFNTGPLNILTTPALAAGASVTILREFDPGATLEAIERDAITLAISAPVMTQALIAHPRWDATDLSSLRCVVTGSATVREEVLAPWFARGVCIVQDYGLTEAMPVVTVVPMHDAHRLRHTAGTPVPHCRMRIANGDGSAVKDGEVGEVLVQGPTVMTEYWRNPEATGEAFHDDGWLRTGDAGWIDDEGMLRIVDRIKHVIIVGSCNVWPADIEAVLAGCEQIEEAAVIGRPDDELGEVPVAFVVPKRAGAIDAGDVKRLFEGRLAAYKHPQDVVFLDALPRNAIGKVETDELRRSL
ncbi:MAG: indoleacetate---CoA ligase [Solirubrobacteraceae bacterium]|nr:indoleacetate---CoA ligase [Solirubrobacteraceae bacterium]